VSGSAPVAEQIEFRWQPDKDLSPIAASISADEARMWSARLSGLIRPATPDPSAGVPACSVAYQDFDDGRTALVWRVYDEHALQLTDGGPRQALVARALIADAELLEVDLAITLCRADATDQFLGTAPGQVPVRAPLSAVGKGALIRVADAMIDELDEVGCHEAGAEWLIAAALRDGDTPLSVLLPANELTMQLRQCPQLALLWVLWRTTARLTTPPQEGRPGRRGWSFSTYEQPLGSTDPRGLAGTVFRSYEQDQGRLPPRANRREIQVWPRSATGQTDRYDETAAVLLDAYRRLGGTELDNRLRLLAERFPYVDARLQACVQEFRGTPAYKGGADLQPGVALHMPDPAAQSADELIDGLLAESGAETMMDPASPGVARAEEPQERPSATQATARYAQPPVTGSGLQDGDETGVLPPDRAGQRSGPGLHRGKRGQPSSLSAILDRIHEGPEHDDFDLAQDLLRRVDSEAGERSKARSSMRDRNWYLPALTRRDPFAVEEQLEEIFAVTVIPDILSREVENQLMTWARVAPPPVIRALSAAAHHDDETSVALLERALRPALHRRWLAEHSIYFAPLRSDLEAPPTASRRHGPFWQIIPNGERTGVVASLLLWLCVVLIAALAWKFL
jgi:hypothetical protein